MFAQVQQKVVEKTGQLVEQAEGFLGGLYQQITPYLPKLLAAMVILVVGWLGALAVAAILRISLRRTGLDRRIAQWTSGEITAAPRIERGVAKTVYYLILIFVLVAFFDTLGLTQVTQSLGGVLDEILTYLPRVLAAALLLAGAWIVATAVHFFIRKVSSATRIDEQLKSQAALEGEQPVSLSKTIADTVYWLVFLLFLPAILNALALPGLLQPVQEMVAKILGFLPNLFAAALILLVGWLAARIIQRIVTNLAAAVGTDNLSERVGLAGVLGDEKLSYMLGLVVYIFTLLPVLVASLNALQLEAVTRPASEMLNMVLQTLPVIFAAALVIFLAYIVARVVATLVTNLLAGIGFDKLPAYIGIGKEPAEGQKTPSQIAGYLLMVAFMLFAVMQALPILGFDLLAGLISQFLVFAGHVLTGLVILAIGLYLANLAATTIRASQLTQAGLLAPVAQASIIVLAGAMALRQMGLANEIITSAFAIVLGGIAIAAAIAFGLGGREAAGRAVGRFLESKKLSR